MIVLYVDGYIIRANVNFAGDKQFLIAARRMSTFVVATPITAPNFITYAHELMSTILQFEMAHTIILDSDS